MIITAFYLFAQTKESKVGLENAAAAKSPESHLYAQLDLAQNSWWSSDSEDEEDSFRSSLSPNPWGTSKPKPRLSDLPSW